VITSTPTIARDLGDTRRTEGRVPWSGGIEGVVVNLSDGAGAGR
jgi:hypothetical protein